MSSAVTTFGVFKSLLKSAVTKDTSIDATTRASMLARIEALPRGVNITLDFSSVESTGGNVSVDDLLKSIEVAIGAGGNNRVVWARMTFDIPVTIAGTPSVIGALPGNVGASSNAAVDLADVGLEYRFSTADAWKTFDRNTVLEEVTAIQFAAAIADQVAALALPKLVIPAQQV
jgi:hypothetical protein